MTCISKDNKKIVVAIDGFSSSGKSTFAKRVAANLGYIFIDSGAMYRAVTLYAIENGAVEYGSVNHEKLISLLDSISISFRFNPDRQMSEIYVNGEWVEGRIRTIEVSNMVSAVSSIPEVRAKLVAMQQEMGKDKGVVMDGRDIGTVVFPDAELKIFVTADPHIRAKRRYDELIKNGYDVTFEQILENITARDYTDQNREVSPLRKADDAIVLDNSNMTFKEEMDWIEPILRDKLSK